jgi:hypothetical protein
MSYWAGRANLEYYRVVKDWLAAMGPRTSLIDVGCHDTPVATWGDFRLRFSIDGQDRPELPGVTKIVGMWPEHRPQPESLFSVITCLQVVEHIVEPAAFCKSLCAAASDAVILSVPLHWPRSTERDHKHDPISESMIAQWMGRQPNLTHITVGRCKRGVFLYDMVKIL